jgi:hypothetical protein
MPEDPDIHAYIDAFTVASNRARSVLIVLTIASVVVFSAIWNSTPGSWTNARLRIAKVALRGCANEWDRPFADSLPPDESRLYERAKKFASDRNIDPGDCKTLEAMVKEFSHVQVEDTLVVRAPFFGAALDINDLGLIGGFTLWIVLLWFRFSLARELGNLRLVFLVAHDPLIRQQAYDLMAMRQVLSSPPIRGQETRYAGRRLVVSLYWLPALLQGSVLVVDCFTLKYGWTVSPSNVVIDLTSSAFAFIMITVFASHCQKLSGEIHGVWTYEARGLGIIG